MQACLCETPSAEFVISMEIANVCPGGFHQRGSCEASRFLPPLHDGHAPFGLHLSFQDALDSYEEWAAEADEPSVAVDGQHVTISSVFCRMSDCKDLLPRRMLDALVVLVPPEAQRSLEAGRTTFANGSRLLLAMCHQRRTCRRQMHSDELALNHVDSLRMENIIQKILSRIYCSKEISAPQVNII